MAKRKAKNAHLVEPTWGQSDDGGPPLTELTSESAGALSPFGEDHSFPLPAERHPLRAPDRQAQPGRRPAGRGPLARMQRLGSPRRPAPAPVRPWPSWPGRAARSASRRRLPTTTQISAASPSLIASPIFGSDGVNRFLVNQPKVSRQPAVNSTSGLPRVGLEEHEDRVHARSARAITEHDHADDRGEEREDAGCAVAGHGGHDLPRRRAASATAAHRRPVRPDRRGRRAPGGPTAAAAAPRPGPSPAARPAPARGRAAAAGASTGKVARRASGRSPLTRAACALLHVEVADEHQRLARAGRATAPAGCSCSAFHPGMKDRWVLQTVNSPNGPSTTAATATRGSSLHQHRPARAREPHRHAGAQRRQPDDPPGRPPGTGTAARCRRWPSRAAPRRWPPSRCRRGCRRARRRTGARRRPWPRRRRRSGRRRASAAGRGRPPGGRARRRPGSCTAAASRSTSTRSSSRDRPCRMLKVAMRTLALCPARGGSTAPVRAPGRDG